MSEKKAMNSISILHPSLRKSDRSKEFKDHEYLTSDDPHSVVKATNELAKQSTGDILMFVSDDLELPKDWEKQLLSLVDLNQPQIIRPDDGLQKHTNPVITFPIMTRKAYEKLGYFFHPDYLSMWVDVDLWWVAYREKILVNAFDLKWKHNHHSIGKSKYDDVYKRSESNWNQGATVFNKRANQFGWATRATIKVI